MNTLARPDRNLLGLTRSELEQLALERGQPRYRGAQIYRALYARRERDFAAITDLSREFRACLISEYRLAYPTIQRAVESRDGSIRYLLGLEDGATVEAVYMPWRAPLTPAGPLGKTGHRRRAATPSGRDLGPVAPPDEDGGDHRTTLCISSQVGCAVDCKFCFTGLLGVKRNLTAGEIVGQVLAIAEAQRLWTRSAAKVAPRLNVVFMGQGEPLLNFAPVMKAVQILADRQGCGIALRRITVSTAGIVPRIYDFARQPVRPKLAISLNASSEEQRSALMPINRKYPLADLMAACRAYPLRPRESLTFEYVMIDGLNDSDTDAARVAELVRGVPSRLNLIPYNGGAELPYRAAPMERVLAFQRVLAGRRVPTFIRISRGQDVMAACGQLSLAPAPSLTVQAGCTSSELHAASGAEALLRGDC